MENENNECFRWCHVRHLNRQQRINSQRVRKTDKEFVDELDYSGVDFQVSLKHYNNRIEKQNDIRIDVFGYENNLNI